MAATMKDISRRTGLALSTISKYLNGGRVREENRVAIEEAVKELDFHVNQFARSLKTSRSKTVGVVIPELSNLFITSVITVMEDVLRKSGYAVFVCDCRTDEALERESVEFLLGKMVDGIINMPVSGDGAHLAPALEKGVPVVLVDRMIDGLEQSCDAVLVDNAGAAKAATEHLIQHGHHKIGIVLGPQAVFTSQQRLLGYQQAFLQRGLTANPHWIAYSDYTLQGGYEWVKRLVQQDISALFVTNYEMTLGAIIAANELGIKIPQQLSLIGFDNLQLSQIVQPRLTIVTQPLEAIGRAAADLLLERLEGAEGPAKSQVLTTGLELGDSVSHRT